jgi:hypothetical protein
MTDRPDWLTSQKAPPTDPTYVLADIASNPVWALAFRLSEVDNDHAPIGWSRYILLARWLLATFTLTERPQ